MISKNDVLSFSKRNFSKTKHIKGLGCFKLTNTFHLVFVKSLLQIEITTVHMKMDHCIVWKSDMAAVLTEKRTQYILCVRVLFVVSVTAVLLV